MKTLELFSGTASFSTIAKQMGHETFTIDIYGRHKPDMKADLINIQGEKLRILLKKMKKSDIIWMSPPCQTFSMASGNRHWTKDRKPKTQAAKDSLRIVDFCIDMMIFCSVTGKYFIIENPRARMRWFMPEDFRKTVWFCQYGDDRAKPTDLWTNIPFTPKQCRNGNKECHHQPAPRGSKTGTQGRKGAIERGKIPYRLIRELIEKVENEVRK